MKKTGFMKWAAVVAAIAVMAAMLTVFVASAAGPLDKIKEILDGNGDGVINYVALGSGTTAGDGVLASEAYPSLVKDALAETGKTVSLANLGMGGMRAEELRYLLDSTYPGDSYTEEKFLGEKGIFAEHGGISALREKYVDAISGAEVITIELGMDNFLTYALDYAFNAEYEADFSVFDAGLQRSAEEIKGRFEDVLNGYIEDGDSPETGVLLKRVIDGVAYAIVGYADNFDAVLAGIYKLNPGVTVTVANIRNPLENLEAVMSGLDFPVPLSMIYGIIVDVANIYMGKLSAYDGAYNFAYVGEGYVQTLSSAFSADVSDEAILAHLGGYAESDTARKALVSIINAALEYKTIDLTAAATTTKDARALVNSILAAANNDQFDLKANADYNALISDGGAMTKLAIAVRVGYGQLPVLPGENGHATIASAFISAIANSTKGADVIKNDMNEIYSLLLGYLDRDTLLDLEYTFSPHYVLNPGKSYYVALGDGSAADRNSYVTALADTLGLSNKIPSKSRYKNLAKSGETPASVLANIGSYSTELAKADLVTIGFNNAATTSYMFEQLETALLGGTPDAINWAMMLDSFDPTLAPQVEEVKAMLKTELMKTVNNERIAETVVVAVESYAYSYLSRLVTYPMLVDQIHSITRGKALVVIVGAYNDMAGATITLDGEEIPLGNYIQYLIDVANLESLVYSALSERTAYVASPDIATKMGKIEMDISSSDMSNPIALAGKFATLFFKLKSPSNYNPTDAGHVKIAENVVSNIKIVDPHICVYDNDCDNRCDICKLKRNVKDHVFDGVCDEECNICGARNKAPKLHEYTSPCDDICGVCGKSRDASAHEYISDCDTDCEYCGGIRVADAEHSFNSWTKADGKEIRSCTACGSKEERELPEDNALGVVIAVVVASVAVLGGGGAALYYFVIKKKIPSASNKNGEE